jgi:ferrous iron transport protein B
VAVATLESPRVPAAQLRLALIGNPNTGKTTLFNALCGMRAKTSNYPGTTTAVRVGRAAASHHRRHEVIDLPGLYDIHTSTPEGRIAADVLSRSGTLSSDVVVVVIDATNLTRNLVLVGEVLAQGCSVVVALNMMDVARSRGIAIDLEALTSRLQCPVIPIIARRGEGIDALRVAIDAAAGTSFVPPADLPPAGATLEALSEWAADVSARTSSSPQEPSAADAFTERLDRYLTHPVYGMLAFVGIMCGLFWALFALAEVPMGVIEALFGQVGSFLSRLLPDGAVRELVTQGIVGGLSGTIVFLPQICLLFFLISMLEDTGYLARAAFVMDGVLSRFGLPGQAFVPLLTSHACALPGIMSTRLIPNRRDRLATILVAPFMSCSARLPVYVLLTSLLFASRPFVAGAAFAGCYLLGAMAGLLTASVFGHTALKGRPRPMILELPSYRSPSLTNALLAAKDQGLSFLRTAGTVIMAICIVMWWLSAYPKIAPPPEAEALRAQAAQPQVDAAQAGALRARADVIQVKAAQAGSFAGQFGRLVQPVFAPMGFDWQLTVGVVSSFLAREVFVSTMSVLEGGAGDSDVDQGVVARIRGMTRADGSPLFTPSTAAAALVFFVLAMQCLPTLAVTRKESGSIRYAALQLGYMSSVAYVAALVMHQALLAAGVP